MKKPAESQPSTLTGQESADYWCFFASIEVPKNKVKPLNRSINPEAFRIATPITCG
jgi:hypothetical protein